jgi:hypothetical protein
MRWQRGDLRSRVYLRLWPHPLIVIRGRYQFGVSSFTPTFRSGETLVAYARRIEFCIWTKRIGLWWRVNSSFVQGAIERTRTAKDML